MSIHEAATAAHIYPRRAFVFPILASTVFVVELATIPIILPSLQADLGLATSDVVWVFNIYGLAVACAVILAGLFADLHRTLFFRSGVVLFAVGACLTAIGKSSDMLLIGRLIQGFGAGLFSVVVPVLLAQIAAARPGRALVTWGGIAGLAATLSPLLVGLALALVSWRIIVLLMGGAICASLLLPKIKVPSRRDRSGILSELGGLLSNTAAWSVLGYIFLTYGAFLYVSFELPRLTASMGLPELYGGAVVGLLWLTFTLMSVAIRDQVDGSYLVPILLVAPVFTGVAALLLLGPDGLGDIALSAVAIGIGLAFSNATSTFVLLRLVPEQQKSLAASFDIMAARLGGVVVVAVASAMELVGGAMFFTLLNVLAIGLGTFSIRALSRTRV